MILEGILRCHLKDCINQDCNCQTLSRGKSYFLLFYIKMLSLKKIKKIKIKVTEEEISVSKKLWYCFVRSIIIESLEKFTKSSRLHMLNAYLQQEKLRSKFKALFELMITEENKPNLREEFSIFRYKFNF